MTEKAFGIGLDVGSTTTKGVMVDRDGSILASYLQGTGASAASAVANVLGNLFTASGKTRDDCRIIGTGYGRNIVDLAHKTVTEITCHSVGVNALNPDIRLLIDVGGQDSKVIRIGTNGRPDDFELNDKCSAGTGRFLEVMARVLEVSMDELGPLALKSKSPCTISSTCTVFAESEVIGRIGSGDSPADIAAGVHQSMASKIASLSKKIGIATPIGVTGGVALNPGFRHYLSEILEAELWVPDIPQLTGALGAAIIALKNV
ncbi:MAG: acyl-CoA dehydratase activase [Candidatus Thorarchaeota archaeon]